MLHNYTLTSLIQTNYMLWKNGAVLCLTPPLNIVLFYLLHIELMAHFVPYQCFLCTVSHETDVVWVKESCRFTAASSSLWHVVNLYGGNVWVSRDCFPAPLPKGKRVGSCSNRSVWHVQSHRIWWKECYDAKCAALQTILHYVPNVTSVSSWERDPR